MEHNPTMDCFVLGASSWECLGREHNPLMEYNTCSFVLIGESVREGNIYTCNTVMVCFVLG